MSFATMNFLTENQIMHNFVAVEDATNFWMANLFSILFFKNQKEGCDKKQCDSI